MRGELPAVDAEIDGAACRGRVISVVLADDHPGVRRTLRLLLERELDLLVVGEADSFDAAVRLVGAHRPAVLVLDLRMPDGSTVQRIERLRAASPPTEIVMTTMHENAMFADAVLRAGAVGYVLKDRADLELCDAVRSAARGEQYRSPRLTGR